MARTSRPKDQIEEQPPASVDAFLKGTPHDFHRTAFSMWIRGHQDAAIAERHGVEAQQVSRWRRREGWEVLARDIAPLVREELVREEGMSLAEVKTVHVRDAKRLRHAVMGMLEGFPIKTLIHNDGTITTIHGHPTPSDMRLLVAAYREAADLEMTRLGETPENSKGGFFSDFAEMLERIWSARRAEVPPRDRQHLALPSAAVVTELSGDRRPTPVVYDAPGKDKKKGKK